METDLICEVYIVLKKKHKAKALMLTVKDIVGGQCVCTHATAGQQSQVAMQMGRGHPQLGARRGHAHQDRTTGLGCVRKE